MDTGLDGQRVLVTGASGGIGAAIATALAGEGGRPIVHCRSQRDAAERVVARCGDAATLAQADLADEAETDRMFADLLAGGARLDAVVVNAGIWIEPHTPVHRMELEQWERTMACDLRSAFLTCRGFLRHLAAAPRDDAAIVFVSSTAGLFGEEGHADYAAAKSAMSYGLNASLKNEIVRLAPRGRVNCVAPGWTRTPMAERALQDKALVARAMSTSAMRKVAEPEDIANAVLWLLSPRLSGHVTGALVPVHGGMEGRLLHP